MTLDTRDRIEGGGQWGFGHLRIGIFEKLVTLEISKNSLYKAIFSSFLDILCITMHFHAIKSSFFAKMDDFLLNHPNFSKFSAPAAPKMGHFRPKLAPFWPLAPSIASLISIIWQWVHTTMKNVPSPFKSF